MFPLLKEPAVLWHPQDVKYKKKIQSHQLFTSEL